MAFGVGEHVAANGTTGTSIAAPALTNFPASGTVVIVTFIWYDGSGNNAGTVTISDENGNNLTFPAGQPQNVNPTTDGVIYIAYAIAGGTAGKTYTANYTTASVLKAISVDTFTVSGGTAAYHSEGKSNATGTNVNAPTVTQTAGDLLYAACCTANHINTVDGSWTTIEANGAGFGQGIGYILSASGSNAVAMTNSAASSWETDVLSFTFTASGGGTTTYSGCDGTGCF
jgi:hypothetical protein